MSIRSEKARLEIERAEKMAGWIRKWNSDGLGNALGRVRDTSGREELDVTIIHDAVDGACRELIPLWPLAAAWMAHGFVGGGVLQHELDMVDARWGRVDAIRVSSCERAVSSTQTRYQQGRAVPAGR